jgi:hypothetical protein
MDYGKNGLNSGGDSMENKLLRQRETEKLFRAKQRRRQELAKLPFERKIRILIELQKIADDIRTTLRGTKRRSWDIR